MDGEWTATVHEKIYERRTRMGLGVDELAERSGVDWNCLMDTEGGEEEW